MLLLYLITYKLKIISPPLSYVLNETCLLQISRVGFTRSLFINVLEHILLMNNEQQIYIVSIVLAVIGMEVDDKDVFSYDDEVITNAGPHQRILIIFSHGLHSCGQ